MLAIRKFGSDRCTKCFPGKPQGHTLQRGSIQSSNFDALVKKGKSMRADSRPMQAYLAVETIVDLIEKISLTAVKGRVGLLSVEMQSFVLLENAQLMQERCFLLPTFQESATFFENGFTLT